MIINTSPPLIEEINKEVYDLVFKESANKICFDCSKPYPKYSSINHGILICEICNEKHKELGNAVSFVKSLNDQWDEYLLSFILRGGNKRFKEALNYYEIYPMETGIDNVYKSKAAEYYRKMVFII